MPRPPAANAQDRWATGTAVRSRRSRILHDLAEDVDDEELVPQTAWRKPDRQSCQGPCGRGAACRLLADCGPRRATCASARGRRASPTRQSNYPADTWSFGVPPACVRTTRRALPGGSVPGSMERSRTRPSERGSMPLRSTRSVRVTTRSMRTAPGHRLPSLPHNSGCALRGSTRRPSGPAPLRAETWSSTRWRAAQAPGAAAGASRLGSGRAACGCARCGLDLFIWATWLRPHEHRQRL